MLFEESGLDAGVVAERGYYTAGRSEVPKVFKDYQRRAGLVVPMYSPDGETVSYQLRPERPRKKGPKYETATGAALVVDVHPRMREEVRSGSAPLLITEGAKTGDAATSRGIPTVVLAGTWGWCVPKARPYRLRPCFDHIRLEGREVMVAFDSDCMTKVDVQRALAALVAALEERGAAVKVIYLPHAPDGSKQGVDDYLAAGGTVKEMFMLARPFEAADIGEIRMSRDERLRALVGDLRRRWWAEEWMGRGGHSDRDVALKLIEAATRSGTPHPDGIRVRVSWGVLQVGAKVSRRTLGKALARLEERGFCYRDNAQREQDKTGAFVLRAKVDQYGEGAAPEGARGEAPRACDRGGLPLRAPAETVPLVPRLRWSRPKFTPRHGLVPGTRKVRDRKTLPPRDRIERLGKIRGAVVDALEVAGGELTLRELCERLHKSRPRDLVRRKTTQKGRDGALIMLEEAGIIECEGDVIRLAPDWYSHLAEARRLGGELEADALAEERRKLKSRAYRERHKAAVSKPSAAGLEAVRRSQEKASEHIREHGRDLVGWVEEEPTPLSPLAVAVRDYLDRCPEDACQPAGWIGSTLWAYELYPGKPTPAETKAAIEELGGAAYLEGILKRTKGAA